MSTSIRAAALAAALAAAAGSAAAQDKIRIGTEGAYPPFNMTNAKGELEGLELDYAKELCARMKAECTFVAQDWDGIIPALLAKRYDAIIASMSITEERKKRIAFSRPYYQTPATVIAPKAWTGTDGSAAALKGKRIGVQSSTIHSNYAEAIYKDSTIRLYPKQDEANADLAAGRLDVVVADKSTMLDFLDTAEGKACCKVVTDLPIVPQYHGTGVGVGLRQEDTALKAKFDAAIEATLADGTFDRIRAKYIPYDIKPPKN